MHSNNYTFAFAAILTVIAAVLLAFASEGLRPQQEANVALEKRSDILRAVHAKPTNPNEVVTYYTQNVAELVINAKGETISGLKAFDLALKDEYEKPENERQLPLYVYTGKDGKKYYVVPLHGVGLWGPIWGYVSVKDDFKTVYGAVFDHKGETPGLGAEISTDMFQKPFEGKTIVDEQNNFVSVRVVKKGQKVEAGPAHMVDAISGGTITSNGVDAMLSKCLKPYLPYFEKLTSNAKP
ncbi:MAG: NADH:ubiquinone reductase (Na(+)-transporting) subunit C [Bacteroidetes Order II. Incertae sedis bacterium]|nr:NADH:ubiquinone reductase (Na(+)-transporting) subunit C [Bacteroidetes Order II. bacterium]